MRLPLLLLVCWFCVGCVQPLICQIPAGSTDETISSQLEVQTTSEIYFRANGVDPTWTLTISPFQIEFQTQASGYEAFRSPHVEPSRAMDSNRKKYSMQTEAGMMEVELTGMSCQNKGSRERFNYEVNVSLQQGRDTVYSYFNGCGDYKTDPDLEAKWILKEIGSDTAHAEMFKDTLPYLILHARGNSFQGYGGCNTIHGRIFSERTLLRFTNLVLGKLECSHMAKEAAFVNALQFSTQFMITDDTLILSNPGGRTLVFVKSIE